MLDERVLCLKFFSRPGHPCLRGGKNIGRGVVDLFKTAPETLPVGHLDRQAGTGIQLQMHRPAVSVDDQIDARVAEAGHLEGSGCNDQHFFPIRNLNAAYRVIRIGMVGDNPG